MGCDLVKKCAALWLSPQDSLREAAKWPTGFAGAFLGGPALSEDAAEHVLANPSFRATISASYKARMFWSG